MKKLIPTLMVLLGFLGGAVVIGYAIYELFRVHWAAGLGALSVCLICGARIISDLMGDE